jgi:ABC-type sulfate/molybdate transport systems ATPase subunit
MVGMVLAFAGVLYIIADLDRPQEGLLRVNQQALIDLQKSMHAAKQ